MNNWYDNLNKSPLTPPRWIFAAIWPLLYTTIFISLYLALNNCYPNCNFTLFFIQLFLNVIWTTLFFKLKKPKLALLDIILLIIVTFLLLIQFYNINKLSLYVLIPYFIWLCFAAYLNLYIVKNN